MRHPWFPTGASLLWLLVVTGATRAVGPLPGEPTGTFDRAQVDISRYPRLSATEAVRYAEMEARPLTQFTHSDLDEFVQLRKKNGQGFLPNPATEAANYAIKSFGQPYKRGAWIYDLGETDCVTFTERCLAFGCAEDWRSAHAILLRLRWRNGDETPENLNREPIFDWIPNNTWLLDEITTSLDAETAEANLFFEGRTLRTSYIPNEEAVAKAFKKLRTGDVVIIMSEDAVKADPVVRIRARHMGIIYRWHAGEMWILHSYPPTAGKYRLEYLLRTPGFVGCKFLRLREDARTLARQELGRSRVTFDASPAQLDNQSRIRKGEFAYVKPSREPDEVVVDGGIEYGVIHLRQGETLWSLFKGGWRSVYALDANADVASRFPEARNIAKDERIFYPIRPVQANQGSP